MGSSSSKSSSSTTYNNTDKRGVADNGSVLVTGDHNALTVESVDAEIVGKALDTVASGQAIQGEGYDKLLDVAAGLFQGAGKLVEGTQQAALDAYHNATTDKAGTIDNRTITVLAIAGAVALVAMKGKG